MFILRLYSLNKGYSLFYPYLYTDIKNGLQVLRNAQFLVLRRNYLRMKYLFIVQGEGRGHMTQAISLSEMLQRNGHEVVEVLVGKSKGRTVPDFFTQRVQAPVHTYETPSFIFNKDRKHINFLRTVLYNFTPGRLAKYNKSIEFIHERIKETKPDVVINFYEMLAGLSHLRFREDLPFINIGHQYLLKHPGYQHGRGDTQGLLFLRIHTYVSSLSATKTLALSFYPMKDSLGERIAVVPPLLRNEVLEMTPSNGNFILGYMLNQGYEKEVREWHEKHPDVELHFFWDKREAPEEFKVDKTLTFHKINDVKFLEFMRDCKGYITTAGFESVCEAMYLGKPIMMIPAHIEQEVNAADAASIGAGIIGNSFNLTPLLDHLATNPPVNTAFQEWQDSAEELFLKHLTTFV